MANNNYRTESKKFFNAQTSQNNTSWAQAAAAYYRQIGSTSKRNFVDAMAEYYAKINSGAISAPVSITSTQKIISSGSKVTGVAPTGTYTNTVTFTVVNNQITAITLS